MPSRLNYLGQIPPDVLFRSAQGRFQGRAGCCRAARGGCVSQFRLRALALAGLGYSLAPAITPRADTVRSLTTQATPSLLNAFEQPLPGAPTAPSPEALGVLAGLLNRPPSPGRLQTISTVLNNLERLKHLQDSRPDLTLYGGLQAQAAAQPVPQVGSFRRWDEPCARAIGPSLAGQARELALFRL